MQFLHGTGIGLQGFVAIIVPCLPVWKLSSPTSARLEEGWGKRGLRFSLIGH